MTEPTDAEIVAVMRDGYNCRYNDEQDHIDFARAVLEKWGRPASVVGEPVAWLDPWTGAKATTDYDAYGKHGIPLYTAPQPAPAPLIARSLAEWHEQDGNVAWWVWDGREWAGEPAWIGTPNCEDWPGYHTHWTPHPEQPVFAALAAQGGK